MRIIVHSGTAQGVITAVRRVMDKGDNPLASAIVFPDLFMGGCDDIAGSALPRGSAHPGANLMPVADRPDPAQFLGRLRADLAHWVERRPQSLFLSLPDAAIWLDTVPLLSGLANLLSDYSDDIRLVLHMAHPAAALTDIFLAQVAAGRSAGLDQEAQVARSADGWWSAASAMRGQWAGHHLERVDACLQMPMPAVDAEGTTRLWAQVFGAVTLTARELPFGPETPETLADIAADLDLPAETPIVVANAPRPSATAICRMLTTNSAITDRRHVLGPLPMNLRVAVLAQCHDGAMPLEAVELAPLTAGLRPLSGGPVPVIRPDASFDPRPLLDALPPALEASRQKRLPHRTAIAASEPRARRKPKPLSPAAEVLLTPQAREILAPLDRTPFWPENRAGTIDETADQTPFPAEPGKKTNSLIVACMKNEGPFVIEWIAYHLAIGVGHFLIFTNDCTDGTTEILDRLAELGHVTRKDNEVWKGKSPQQHALNAAMRLDILQNSDWIIHIDVDEYINIRVGNGTMTDLFEAMGPDTTNLAMTWRLFGNAGVDDIGDGSVLDRFTGCSPTYCPKPHTIWGFKSMTRNNGAYAKLSCHRPNKWDPSVPVKWLNGSLKDTTAEFRDKGWRSTVRTVGFDAVQLNHYALRSRESFLIKRQRGRALHVDRSIGLDYWIRHDWNRNVDRTILRHLPRMQAHKQALLADPVLARLHSQALNWHKTRVRELLELDAFQELWRHTTQADLTDPERVAYAIAAGTES